MLGTLALWKATSRMEQATPASVGKRLVELGLVDHFKVQEILEREPATGNELLRQCERQGLLTPFQIAKLEKGDKNGYFVGRFKILYKISAGTFARVYRAVEPGTGQVVAVKVLRGRQTLDPENIKHFQREGRLVEGFNHANVTRTLAVGTDAETNQHFIAMEFIEGGNLRELLKIRTKFEAREFLKLAREMVEGLRYALSRGVTHRDIKPTNILITADGRVKWVDFGLAGVMEQSAGINKTFGIVQEQRTVDYAGLEKATGAPKGDPRSDIFFLGNVFHHMLTGEPALDETKDRQARMMRNRFENSTPLAGNPSVPREVAAVVDRMLSFRPEARYQNYDQVLRDLEDAERVLAGDVPAGSPRPGVKPRVIVVHESNSVKDAIKTKLSEKGCQVVLTTDVERAAALHAMNPFDVMILDLDTVGESGVNSFQRVARQNRSGKPCTAVFLAEGAQRGWTDRLKGAEFAVIDKPMTLRDLYQTVLSRIHIAE